MVWLLGADVVACDRFVGLASRPHRSLCAPASSPTCCSAPEPTGLVQITRNSALCCRYCSITKLPTSSSRRIAPSRTPVRLTSRVWTSSEYALPEMSLPDILTGNTAFDRSPLRGLPTPAFCTIAARALFGEVNATSLFVRMAQF